MIINVLKRTTDGSGAVASSCASGSVHHHFSANYHGLISQWGCWLSSRGVLRRWFSGPTAVSGVSILCFDCPTTFPRSSRGGCRWPHGPRRWDSIDLLGWRLWLVHPGEAPKGLRKPRCAQTGEKLGWLLCCFPLCIAG